MSCEIRDAKSAARVASVSLQDTDALAACPSIAFQQGVRAERLTLIGGVQGFGIRPAIARLACELQLRGTVRNEMVGVVIELEGLGIALEAFAKRLRDCLPEPAIVLRVERESIVPQAYQEFSIQPSDNEGLPQTAVPTDLKICDQCLAELRDSTNRRFGYAFTSCTDCGPRFSILRSMPFDRERTSMSHFTMCEACTAEYDTARDRRFHSQSNCCASCGPRVWFSRMHGSSSSPNEAIGLAAEVIRRGEILALKGLGGYQLLCDATNESAVQRMRSRKQRPSKPLAIMVRTLVQAESLAIFSPLERQAICSPVGPIVLVESRQATVLAEAIHPGLNTVGVMLPTTALHVLLTELCQAPLVVTSGNTEGEPLVYCTQSAEDCLAGIADGFLHHDREIVQPVDDSVVRCMVKQMVTIRAARGLTPLVVDLKTEERLLAVGGQQKVSIALSNGWQAILGPHLGDLASVANRDRFEQHIEATQLLYACRPGTIVHDMHPDYFSTRWASEQKKATMAVQHHHAHIVAGMLEHGWMDQIVLGIAFDGTGWSGSGMIAGGEILLATATSFERVGSLRPFPLFGGEAAIREPNRIAMALLLESLGPEASEFRLMVDQTQAADHSMRSLNWELLTQRRFSPLTTSVGRLFDGVAAIAFGDFRPSYEGELAMRWEAICDHDEVGAYPFHVTPGVTEIDWRMVIQKLVLDRKRNVPAGVVAMRFHRGLAIAIASVVEKYSNRHVVLSGGVFQNRVLVELVKAHLPEMNRTLGWPGKIPPNDGGLSIGQLAVAAARSRLASLAKSELKEQVPSCA